MGAFELILPLFDPSECSNICVLQYYVIPYNESSMESMISFDVPLDNIVFFISKDLLPRLDSCAIKSTLNFPSKLDLTIYESS